ncbi:hypothetical protein ABZP36_028110 [Zizania latifolia]
MGMDPARDWGSTDREGIQTPVSWTPEKVYQFAYVSIVIICLVISLKTTKSLFVNGFQIHITSYSLGERYLNTIILLNLDTVFIAYLLTAPSKDTTYEEINEAENTEGSLWQKQENYKEYYFMHCAIRAQTSELRKMPYKPGTTGESASNRQTDGLESGDSSRLRQGGGTIVMSHKSSSLAATFPQCTDNSRRVARPAAGEDLSAITLSD